MDMANAIGETRAVARQGSSRHDEMDVRAGGWMDSGRGWSQDKRGLLLHATALYLDWHTETELGGWAPCWPWHRLTRERAGVDTP